MMRRIAALLCAALAAQGAWATDDSAALREHGRALFHGERLFERAATVAGAALPADAAACARCHGVRGEGVREGGVAVPSLQGQTAAALDAAALDAAAYGTGRDGRALQAAMPRYAWSASERAALAAFVAVLGSDDEPVRGVTRDSIVLGSLLPAAGPRAAVGQAILQGLRQHFDAVNADGGLYGRRIEVQAIDAQAIDERGDLRQALLHRPVLALVGSLAGDLLSQTAAQLQALRLPMIGNLGPSLADGAAASWSSTLMPSVQAQLQRTAAEFEQRCPSRRNEALHVTHAPLPGLRDAVQAALPGRTLVFEDTPTDTPTKTPTHTSAGARRVLALHGAAPVAAVRAALKRGDCLWTLAMFSGAGHDGAAAELVVLPGPAALPLAGGDPQALWPSLGRLSAQLAAEALARAGRRVQPEDLADATLPAFEPAPGVRLELSRTRRHALPVLTTWRDHER